jgi:hypothetical protein
MTHATDPLTAARSEALFTSHLSAGSPPSRAEVHAAIRHAIRAYGGTRGCAGEVAAAYGEHPDIAAPRMRWARQLVQATYPPGPQPSAPRFGHVENFFDVALIQRVGQEVAEIPRGELGGSRPDPCSKVDPLRLSRWR